MARGKPLLMQVETPLDTIAIIADFPNMNPYSVFDFWVTPDLLKKWWPPEAELDPKQNGAYRFAWPKQNWTLRGTFTEFKPGRVLGFTWTWDHEPNDRTHVRVEFRRAQGGGTRLELSHGNYSPADSEMRKGHLEGWMYFLQRLQEQL